MFGPNVLEDSSKTTVQLPDSFLKKPCLKPLLPKIQ